MSPYNLSLLAAGNVDPVLWPLEADASRGLWWHAASRQTSVWMMKPTLSDRVGV